MKKLLSVGLLSLFSLYATASSAQDMTFTFALSDASYNQVINNAVGQITFLCNDQNTQVGPIVEIGKDTSSFQKNENNVYVASVTIAEQNYQSRCKEPSSNAVNIRAVFLKSAPLAYGSAANFEYVILNATPATLKLDPKFVQNMFLTPG